MPSILLAGILCTLIGVFMIKFPEFLSYIFGGLFVFIGANILIFAIALFFRRGSLSKNTSSFKFGGYEIIRKKK